jgi:hypothetical protein
VQLVVDTALRGVGREGNVGARADCSVVDTALRSSGKSTLGWKKRPWLCTKTMSRPAVAQRPRQRRPSRIASTARTLAGALEPWLERAT